MRAEIVTYKHRENGISLFVVPETEAERDLLDGLWRHGKLATCNGVADGTGKGFAVQWRLEAEQTVQ